MGEADKPAVTPAPYAQRLAEAHADLDVAETETADVIRAHQELDQLLAKGKSFVQELVQEHGKDLAFAALRLLILAAA